MQCMLLLHMFSSCMLKVVIIMSTNWVLHNLANRIKTSPEAVWKNLLHLLEDLLQILIVHTACYLSPQPLHPHFFFCKPSLNLPFEKHLIDSHFCTNVSNCLMQIFSVHTPFLCTCLTCYYLSPLPCASSHCQELHTDSIKLSLWSFPQFLLHCVKYKMMIPLNLQSLQTFRWKTSWDKHNTQKCTVVSV